MSTDTELERLRAIEARLIARWCELEARRLEALPLVVRMAEDGEQYAIERALGYRPQEPTANWYSHNE